ncbi:unnamed protein product [Closterium sp. NIES-54]
MQLENLCARWKRDRLAADEFFIGLANTLTGEAETYYRICWRELLDWAEQGRPGERDPTKRFLEILRDQFPLQMPERVVEFHDFKRRTGESLLAYYGRLVELGEDMNCVDQGRLVSKFLNGLNYELQRDVQVKIFEMGAAAMLRVVYETAKRLETRRRLFKVEQTGEHSVDRWRPAWSASPVEYKRSPRGLVDARKCHNCGKGGHLRQDCRNPPACSICGKEEHLRRECLEASTCENRGRRGHGERDYYSHRGDAREKGEMAEMQTEIEKKQAQLEGRERGTQRRLAIVAREEEKKEGSEQEFFLIARPARDKEELGLRPRERYLRHRVEERQEYGPRRQAGESREELPPRRHPLERLRCAAPVLVAEKGYITVGGLPVKQAIIDTGAHPVLIGKRLAEQLQLDRPKRQIAEGLLLMIAEGGGTKWMPKTCAPVEIMIRRGSQEECSVKIQCGILPRVFQKPIVLLELFGGISTGLAAVLKAGLRGEKYIYVDNDGAANIMAWHHIKKLEERYPLQLYEGAVDRGVEWICHRVEDVKEEALAHWGHIDLVIAGWECQGMSRAREGRGMNDPRSGLFRELIRILRLIKRKQGEVAYIVENMDTRDDGRDAVKQAEEEIKGELGAGVSWDAALNGSRTHRSRRY